ncbi:hypothetical protein [Streptomyces sp. NPDC037389]|uniref:hypothetical protein n=1 Tax=Streptomyces sp. NPDC037389 TaxID=3155369 RepID=UPI0033E5CC63
MSTTRAEAMTALRDWARQSTSGRRAELVGAAWRAGETNVSRLAEAAGTSRPTVYADLRDQDIDPDERPKEKDMTTPITIEGLNGTNDLDDGRPIYNIMLSLQEGKPTATYEEAKRLMSLSAALSTYNGLRTRLAEEDEARAERDRALHLVKVRWDALADPTNKGSWLHSHQAYVRAVDAAHRAIDTWKTAADALIQGGAFRRGVGEDRMVDAYEQHILAAGYPALPLPDTDAETEAATLHDELTAEHTHRQILAAETLGLATAQN